MIALAGIGWLHTVASVLAMILGAMMLVRVKGNSVHRRNGQLYVAAMVVTNLTALVIYRQGRFFFPHGLAVLALVVVVLGFCAARFKRPVRHWLSVHVGCLVVSYYLLIGGAINEAFLRVPVLRALAPNFNSPVIGWTHAVVQLVFIGLLVYFLMGLRRRRSGLGLSS